jgi:hypothetical protein
VCSLKLLNSEKQRIVGSGSGMVIGRCWLKDMKFHFNWRYRFKRSVSMMTAVNDVYLVFAKSGLFCFILVC